MKLISMIMSSIIAMIAVLPMASVLAADSYWGSSTGNFSDGSSWESGGVPGVGDNANFTNAATYDVALTADAGCENAIFSAPSGVVSIDPGDYEWTLNGGLTVADTVRVILGYGELTTSGDNTITTAATDPEYQFIVGHAGSYKSFTWNIEGGVTTITTPGDIHDSGKAGLYIGNKSSWGYGVMNVSGANTYVTNSADVYIGFYTWGSTEENKLTVSGGAEFRGNNNLYIGRTCNNRKLLVTGEDSLLSLSGTLFQGKIGDDTSAIISDGARLETGGDVVAGAEGGDRSYFLATGAGTEIECTKFKVANAGSDDCNVVISNGAYLVANGDFNMGDGGSKDAHGNTLTIIGEGTVVTQTTGNVQWWGATNTLRVLDGAMVWLNQASGVVPNGEKGALEVIGKDTCLSINRLYASDNQTIVVTNGATLNIRDAIYSGYTGAPGYIEVKGSNSVLSVADGKPCRFGNQAGGKAYLTVSDGGFFEHSPEVANNTIVGYEGSGVISINGKGSVFEGNPLGAVYLGYLTGATGEVTVENQGFFSSNSTVIGDRLGSTGTVTIVGSGVWTNSNNVMVGGYSDDGNSKSTLAFVLDEEGVSTVHIDGTLYVRPTEAYLAVDLSGYDTDVDTEFVLVECGTLSGTFDEDKISVTGLNGGTIVQDTVNDQIILQVNGALGTVILIE